MKHPILGWSSLDPATRELVVYPGTGPLATVARPRTGKSRSLAFPNLYGYEGSTITLCFKPELAEWSAIWRQQMLGQGIEIFDPFNVVEDKYMPKTEGVPCKASIDLLGIVNRSVSKLATAFKIAEAMIEVAPGENQPHFPEAAQGIHAAIDLFVATDPLFDGTEHRNKATAWSLFADKDLFQQALEDMAGSKNEFIKDQANAFLGAGDDNREMPSILNAMRTQCTRTYSEPGIMETLCSDSMDFSKLNEVPTSVYIVLPGALAATHYRYVRLVLTMILLEIERGGLAKYGSEQPPTLVLLDEFASLKNYKEMLEMFARLPGYACQFFPFFHSFSQLEMVYGKAWRTIVGNVGVINYFGGTGDDLTATEIAKQIGKETIVVHSSNVTPGQNRAGNTYGLHGRDLKMPDEIMRYPLPQQINIFIGAGAMETYLIDPSWSDFPDYLAFMKAIESGWTPEQAAITAHRVRNLMVHQANVNREPAVKERRRKPFVFPAFDPLGWLNKLIAMLMGHEGV